MKRRPPPQLEINWGEPEPFALVPITTLDGDRIAREKQQQQSDREHAEKEQVTLV